MRNSPRERMDRRHNDLIATGAAYKKKDQQQFKWRPPTRLIRRSPGRIKRRSAILERNDDDAQSLKPVHQGGISGKEIIANATEQQHLLAAFTEKKLFNY